MSQEIHHRAASAHSFNGIEIHAARGVHEAALDALRDAVSPGARVADLGAGSGAFSARLKAEGFEPVAVDMNVSARLGGIPFIEADISDLGSIFDVNSLSAVVAIEVVEHLRNPLGFVEAVFAALEPGGVFLLTTPNILHPFGKFKFVVNGTFTWFSRETYWTMGHMTPLPEWILRSHLTSAGFERIHSGLVGEFSYGGLKGLLVKTVLRQWGNHRLELGVQGDGSNLLMVAHKPRTEGGVAEHGSVGESSTLPISARSGQS